jgi:sulfate/thiosulfate-binding protein
MQEPNRIGQFELAKSNWPNPRVLTLISSGKPGISNQHMIRQQLQGSISSMKNLFQFLWILWKYLSLPCLMIFSGCDNSPPDSLFTPAEGVARSVRLLNVSYDPTREFYLEFNRHFAEHWRSRTGQQVIIDQSHGGAAKQARAVIDGLKADVVTLALSYDIDTISATAKLLPEDWQQRLPHNSCPYTSTIVFLVRQGNPRKITDWNDLIKPGIQVITPNPKTSGGARWNYLAAWGFAMKYHDRNEALATQFIRQLFSNVPLLDSGARGSTTTFVQRGIGDVLITWENEAFLAVNEFGPEKIQIVVPSISILTEPPVATIDRYASDRNNLEVANAYLEFLYHPTGQRLAAKHYYRPIAPEHADAEHWERFPQLELLSIDKDFGGWPKAQAKHFSDGGLFDQIYTK